MQVDEYNPSDDLLSRYRKSLASLDALGVRISRTSRLRRYEGLLQRIVDDQPESVESSTMFALAFALREIDELVEIVEHLPDSPDTELLRLLSLLPKGNDQPDDDLSAKAREAQYELYLGSVFRRAGLVAQHGKPDLTISFNGSSIYLEAKRPGDKNSVDDRVRKAVHQLRSAPMAGIIAISLDQVIRPQGNILAASSLHIVASEVARIVSEYALQELSMWRKRLAAEPVDALLLTARVPARLESGELVLGTNIHLVPISQTGPKVTEFLTASVDAYQQAQARGAV